MAKTLNLSPKPKISEFKCFKTIKITQKFINSDQNT